MEFDNMLYLREISLKSMPTDYTARLPVVRTLQEHPLVLHQPVTFLVGENGTGKSTLLEAIAVAAGFHAEGGTRNFNFSTCDDYSALFSHSQFLIATHSPILTAFPNAEILELDEHGFRPVNYQDAENYRITKQFLDNPAQMLHHLLRDN